LFSMCDGTASHSSMVKSAKLTFSGST
jgi:hypothetical protein